MEFFKKIKNNENFCLITLIVGSIFTTSYCFFKNPVTHTASMIGREYPLHFKLWGILSVLAILFNVQFMYKKYNYHSKLSNTFLLFGCACILATVYVPSTETMGLQLIVHWSTALLFAFFNALSITMFLFNKSKESGRVKLTLITFLSTMLFMLGWLLVFGKNGVIEMIPTIVGFLLLYVFNYTDMYIEKNKENKYAAKI
ncbi:MAG: hypothetical protein LBH71_04440 [Oscillospiraceae bacterium]|jgi:hypothetical protein|nr:hypothetical protein [Oscillospiraceae bacterium]